MTRRQFLFISALLSFGCPITMVKYVPVADAKNNNGRYPLTIDLLKEAYWAEMTAYKHYDGYCQKALSGNYHNFAYLFHALSISEKIHADNYQNLIVSLGSSLEQKKISISIADTKTNLNVAATKELEKINDFYPDILSQLSSESHDQAVLSCMYSWKSHQQHEEIINDIKRYSGLFFGSIAKKIESMNPNYYVCEICGSTVPKKPEIPCEICNYPKSHYKKLNQPI